MGSYWIHFLGLACFLLPTISNGKLSPNVYRQELSRFLQMKWELDYDNEQVFIEVEFRPFAGVTVDTLNDWVAIGFSDEGSLRQADIYILWKDESNNYHISNAHTSRDGILFRDWDEGSNFKVLGHEIGSNLVNFAFVRPFDTCNDKENYRIEDGTTHVVWAVGQGPLDDINGLNISDPDATLSGFSRLRLLKVEDMPTLPEGTENLDITHSINVPSDDTTYWCSVHKLPPEFQRKHHVIQYEPVKHEETADLLHHMELFHCDGEIREEFPIWSGPCNAEHQPSKLEKCKKVLAAWAIGAGPFTYPMEAGLAIGGPDFNPYVMLEVHYNNQDKKSGLHDESGIRLSVSQKLRQYDAGILELGLIYSDKMAIPPHMEDFPLTGVCVPECTNEAFPTSGITIFGSQLHTHGAGVKVATKHFREGIELPEVNRDNHYSTHFQEIRALSEPKNILPGDFLTTTCWYNTMDRQNATVGGYSFKDEMCLNYVHYYPRTEVEICKSAISDKDLASYFHYLNGYANQQTDLFFKSPRENFNSIEWNQERSKELDQLFQISDLQIQCQAGNGKPMGRYDWLEISPPEITQPRPPHFRHCQTLNSDMELEKRPLLRRKLQSRMKKTPLSSKLLPSLNKAPEANTLKTKRIGFDPKNIEIYRILLENAKERRRGIIEKKAKRIGIKLQNTDLYTQKPKRIGFNPESVAILQANTEQRKKIWQRSQKRQLSSLDGWLYPYYIFSKSQEKKRSGSPLNEMKKRSEKISLEHDLKPEDLLEDMELRLKDSKRQKKGSTYSDQLNKFLDEITEANEVPWSDYDNWGLDRKKKGLGSFV